MWENQIEVEQDAKKYRIKGFIMDENNSEEERSTCKIQLLIELLKADDESIYIQFQRIKGDATEFIDFFE